MGYSCFFFSCTDWTWDKSKAPQSTMQNPSSHIPLTFSFHNHIPRRADVPKLAAVASPVPATDPLSSIPSRNAPIINVFIMIITTKHTSRGTHSTTKQTLSVVDGDSMQVSRIQPSGESGESANLAKQDAVAPNTPLNRAVRSIVRIVD